jgi:hypothetical protein
VSTALVEAATVSVVLPIALIAVVPGACGDAVVLALAIVPADTAAAAATPATSAIALRLAWRAGEAPGDVRPSRAGETSRRGAGNASAGC